MSRPFSANFPSDAVAGDRYTIDDVSGPHLYEFNGSEWYDITPAEEDQ